MVWAGVLAVWAAAAGAQEARVRVFEGPALVRPWGWRRSLALAPGNELIAGDMVRTGSGGSATVVFANGTVVELGENARLLISGTTRRAVGELHAGEALVRSAGRPFFLRTLSAVAATRDGAYRASSEPGGHSSFTVLEQGVELRTLAGRLGVFAGESASVRHGEAPRKR